MNNDIFKLDIPEETTTVGFTDDVTILVTATNLDDVQIYADESIRII